MPRHITLNTKMSAKFSMSEPQCTYDGQELETQGVDHLISEELLVERSRAFIAANLHQDKMLRFFLGVFFFFFQRHVTLGALEAKCPKSLCKPRH